MAECSKCGEQAMTFTCKYCGEKFCSEHRLPENHDCNGLEEGVEQEKEEEQKWFQEKDVRDELKIEEPRKAPESGRTWILKEAFRSLKRNATLTIIVLTVLSYLTQSIQPGITPPITAEQASMLFENPTLLNPLTLFASPDYLIQRPWTVVTLMFLHGGTFHLFANMVTLYFFGRPVENITGPKEFLKFYFGAGIVASIGLIVFQNLLTALQGNPAFFPAVGASGAVVACFAAVAMVYPDAEVLLYFFIPMKIKTALYAFGTLEIVNIVAKLGGVYLPIIGSLASSAHLTGMAIGIWYGRRLRRKRASKTSVLDLLGA